MREPTPPPEVAPAMSIDRKAYTVAKARAGIPYDMTVAERLGVHPVTWSRILAGTYPLTEAKAKALAELFPDDADAMIVRPA